MKRIWVACFRIFEGIVIGSLVSTSIVCEIFGLGALDSKVLWQILLVSALCALSSLIQYLGEHWHRLRMFIQVLVVYTIVLGCGYLFKWDYLDSRTGILLLAGIIGLTFVLIQIIAERKTRRESAEINARMNSRHQSPPTWED